MLDLIESYLARLTGRSTWPTAIATMDEQLKVPGGVITPRGEDIETSDIFTYEVDGQFFDRSVREVLGEKDIMGRAGNTVTIQYNPRRPKQFYYAPARQLASRAMFASVIVFGILAIAVEIYIHS